MANEDQKDANAEEIPKLHGFLVIGVLTLVLGLVGMSAAIANGARGVAMIMAAFALIGVTILLGRVALRQALEKEREESAKEEEKDEAEKSRYPTECVWE